MRSLVIVVVSLVGAFIINHIDMQIGYPTLASFASIGVGSSVVIAHNIMWGALGSITVAILIKK